MPTAGVKVLFVGKSWPLEAMGYQVEVCSKINQLMGQLAKFKPDVIISSEFVPGALSLSGFEVRKRWLHIGDVNATAEAVSNAVESCYGSIIWKEHPYAKTNPLISVYTPTYNTGDFLRDTYQSLRDQKYNNWEWVVIDDGSTDGTWDRLKEMAAEDYRVRPMQVVHAGKIGLLKGMATKLAHGEFVVELDHDDMLTDMALEEVRKAFLDPEVGMVYSNCACFYQNGTPQKYNGEFWESKYRETEYRGKVYTEARGPDIYDRFGPNYWQQFGWFLTVGPNHLRAYRRTKLEEFGGYNPTLPVADDWDVFARFFLRSKCVWLDQLLYLYRFLDGYSNTTFTKNKSIQDHLELGRRNYAEEFDAFNKKRLGQPGAPTNDSNILLTVAMPSVGDRLTGSATALLTKLFKQAEGKPVEILCLMDNRMSTVSEKRNRAIRDANGRYMAFVDDDDMVADDYIDTILKAICDNPKAQLIVYDVWVEGYAVDGTPGTKEKPAVDRINKQGLEYPKHTVTPTAYYCGPSQWMTWRTDIMRKAPPYPDQNCEDVIWAAAAKGFVDPQYQVRVDKLLYYYKFDAKNTTQGVAMNALEKRKRPLSAWGLTMKGEEAPVAPSPTPSEVAFVSSSKDAETAKPIREMLKDVPHYVAVGKSSLLEAYEEGRKSLNSNRIVYLHDDCKITDIPKFIEMVKALPPGLHGACGSADPAALKKDNWWDTKPLLGKLRQHVYTGEWKLVEHSKAEKLEEAQWLDGFCLVVVDQKWDWKLRGNPKVWHGYDWLACKRTFAAGGKCYVFPQPGEPLVTHYGLGGSGDFAGTLKTVRALARTPQERNDWPNIHEHYGKLTNFQGNILDLGCNEGVTTSGLLEGAEKYGGHVWSVDATDRAGIFSGHPQWTFTQCDSLDAEALKAAGLPDVLDVVCIDTDHTYERTQKELALWGPRVRPGGKIILHDTISFPAVNKALDEYLAKTGYACQKDANCNGLATVTIPGRVDQNLSVVVVDWNTKDKTLACVKSVRMQYPEAEIVLVQNGEHFPCEMANKTVQLEMNLGYSAGVNRGVMEATREYVCLLNSDTNVAQPKFFEKLVGELVKDPTVGIVAPYSSYARPPQGNFAEKDCPQDSKDVPVVFVCVVFRKALFDELGGMDPMLCTFEDDDFVQRVLRKGLKSRVVGGVWLNHEGHASFRKNGLDPFKVQDENQVKFKKKWPTVAVVAITKDEMVALPGFFDQFKGVFNYGAILDSGSTDGTVDWAKQHGVRVGARDFTRFDEQRNEAAKLAHDADWILMLDPDERLDENTIKCIPDLVRSDEFDIYLAPLRAENRDGSFTEWVGKPFLFRNKPEIRWALPVHEKLIGSKRQAWVKNGMITHVIKLHTGKRRQDSEHLYARLADLPRQDISAWPVLDYNHREHPAIEKIVIGPLVSVVIPSYNRLKMLTRAVESVKSQDYRPVEVVVVGDGCPQLAPQALAAEQGVRAVNLPKCHGAGGAVPRNYGIALASGRWIAYLDDDNTWGPNHLSSLMTAVVGAGAEYGISSMTVFGDKVRVCDKPEHGKVDSSCILHRKDLVERFGWWKNRIDGGYAHDWEFVSRWVSGGVKWAATKLPTCLYSAETSGQEQFLRELVGAKK